MSGPSGAAGEDDEHSLADGVAFALAVAFAGLHVYRGLTASGVVSLTLGRNYTIAAVVLAGVAVYFTAYWMPVLYLVGAVFVGTLTVYWALQMPVMVALEVSRLVLGTALSLVLVYLFNRERVRLENVRS